MYLTQTNLYVTLRTKNTEQSADGNIEPKKEEVRCGRGNCAMKILIIFIIRKNKPRDGIGGECSTQDEAYETLRILVRKPQTH